REAFERSADGIRFAARVDVDVVAVSIGPIDGIGRQENLAAVLFDEQTLRDLSRTLLWFALASQTNLFLRAIERALEASGVHRLQQIVERFGVEGRQRVLLMRGEKHDVEIARFWCGRRGRQYRKTVHVGHLDVEEHEIGRETAQRGERVPPGRGLTDLAD